MPGKSKKQKKVTVVVKEKHKKKSNGVGRTLLRAGGAAIGSTFGPIGTALGSAAGSVFSRILGMGAYKIKSNSLMNGQVPMFSPKPYRFSKAEFISNVAVTSTTGDFELKSYAINPGILSTFPFLSQIAANFEEYRFHGLVFQFRSTSSNALNSTNTALGVVIMATNYDVEDGPFNNKVQMESYEFACSTKPSESILHPVECAPLRNVLSGPMYVRPMSDIQIPDLRFHDLGNFQIATVGMQAASVIGELWVTYDVEFFKPRLTVPLSVSATGALYSFTPTTSGHFVSPVQKWDNIGLQFDSTQPNRIYITQPGKYVFHYQGIAGTTWTDPAELKTISGDLDLTNGATVSTGGGFGTTYSLNTTNEKWAVTSVLVYSVTVPYGCYIQWTANILTLTGLAGASLHAHLFYYDTGESKSVNSRKLEDRLTELEVQSNLSRIRERELESQVVALRAAQVLFASEENSDEDRKSIDRPYSSRHNSNRSRGA